MMDKYHGLKTIHLLNIGILIFFTTTVLAETETKRREVGMFSPEYSKCSSQIGHNKYLDDITKIRLISECINDILDQEVKDADSKSLTKPNLKPDRALP
jgi:hypothetical protein